ncbi:phosphotransferase family protein [Streptodolium elevatio]
MNRLLWNQLPDQVRAAAEGAFGAPVAAEISQSGGFSPGLASRLTLADGRRIFAKAINPDRDPLAPELYRREARAMAAMPAAVPAPALLWTYDDGDWVMLVLEDVDGRHPREPWQRDELQHVMSSLAELAAHATPSPLSVPSVVDDLADNFGAWQALLTQPQDWPRLDPWARDHLALLADLESGWADAAKGDTLVHADLRADNLIVTGDRVVVIDWPYAVAGAPWLDALFLLPSVAESTHGMDPQPVWESYPPAQAADPGAVDAVLAALAGDWTRQSLRPAPPNLPTLRAHQAAKGAATLRWLRSRLA